MVDKIVKTQNEALSKALEEKLTKLDREIADLKKKINNGTLTDESYGTALQLVLGLLKQPAVVWQRGGYEGKRLITKLVFIENPVYDRKQSYGTAALSSSIKLFDLLSSQKTHDVEMPEIESGSNEKAIELLRCVDRF